MVHVVGGTCALIGSILVGPRQGRFVKNSKIVKQNAVFQVLGELLFCNFSTIESLVSHGNISDDLLCSALEVVIKSMYSNKM